VANNSTSIREIIKTNKISIKITIRRTSTREEINKVDSGEENNEYH
jgi:hypothetical protein